MQVLQGPAIWNKTSHERLAEYLDVVWAVANWNPSKQIASLALESMILTANIRFNRILQQPVSFKRNWFDILCSTTLQYGVFI